MIPSDDNRRRQFAAADHLVKGQPEPGALAVPQPAHARRQALERDALTGEADPAPQTLVLRKEALNEPVGLADILGVAG